MDEYSNEWRLSFVSDTIIQSFSRRVISLPLMKSLVYLPRSLIHVHTHIDRAGSRSSPPLPRPSRGAHLWKRTRSINDGIAKVTLTFSSTTLNVPRELCTDRSNPIANKKELMDESLAERNFHKEEKELYHELRAPFIKYLIYQHLPLYRRNFPPSLLHERSNAILSTSCWKSRSEEREENKDRMIDRRYDLTNLQ